jgi:hypothetical protein
MKKSLLVAAIAALSSFGAFAQNYYYFKTVGVPENYTSTPPSEAASVITGTATSQAGVISSAQSFPFASWQFYGFTVNQFKVSTSGYISFDPSLASDISANTALPNASAPKLAIFAFWDNTRIQTLTQNGNTFASDIKSWTYGSAPNREFAIQWRLVQTNDGTTATNVTYYAVVFHEAGGFDIIHNYGFGAFSATTGCQDLTAANGISVTGSPAMNFGGNDGSNDPKKSAVYHFKYGTQPVVDMVIKKTLTPNPISANATGGSIKISADNYGSAAITTAKMNYQINGGATVTASVNTSIDANGGTAVVTHPTAYIPVGADAGTSKTVKVWFSEINGGAATSDPLEFSVFINKGISGTKKVLIEEGSGAWCGYCPDGHFRMKEILNANAGNVIGVVHHNADGMINAESNTFNTTYATGYPYGTVDRMRYEDMDEVGMNRGEWDAKATSQLNGATPVNVTIMDKTFDWVTRTVSYKVKVDFVDYAKPGDLRINTMIIEDKVRGPKIGATSLQWNQRNYYSYEAGNQAGGSSHPLFSEPAYIVGYNHNEVVRAIPSGVWGTAGVITSANQGQSFEQTYSYQLPVANALTYGVTEDDTEYRSTKDGLGWNKYEDTRIIAFVSYYNADVNSREVLNVTEVPMLTTGVKETAQNNVGNLSVNPNPANGMTSVTFDLKSGSKAEIEAVNVLGQKVASIASSSYAAGEHTVYFNVADLENGIYFVNVTTAEGKATYRFVVSK